MITNKTKEKNIFTYEAHQQHITRYNKPNGLILSVVLFVWMPTRPFFGTVRFPFYHCRGMNKTVLHKLGASEAVISTVPLDTLLMLVRQLIKEEIRNKANEDLQEKLLSPQETCKLFHPSISVVTLNAWTKKGILKEYRYGGRVYYKYSEIIECGQHLKRYSIKTAA